MHTVPIFILIKLALNFLKSLEKESHQNNLKKTFAALWGFFP